MAEKRPVKRKHVKNVRKTKTQHARNVREKTLLKLTLKTARLAVTSKAADVLERSNKLFPCSIKRRNAVLSTPTKRRA